MAITAILSSALSDAAALTITGARARARYRSSSKGFGTAILSASRRTAAAMARANVDGASKSQAVVEAIEDPDASPPGLRRRNSSETATMIGTIAAIVPAVFGLGTIAATASDMAPRALLNITKSTNKLTRLAAANSPLRKVAVSTARRATKESVHGHANKPRENSTPGRRRERR